MFLPQFLCLSGQILFTNQNEQVGRAKCPNLEASLHIQAIYYVNMLHMIVYFV